LSGKLGKQSLRFRAAKTFFFGITLFLYQNENPVHQMVHGRQFYTSMESTQGLQRDFLQQLDEFLFFNRWKENCGKLQMYFLNDSFI
jgi:hypothetical protein